MANIPFKTLLKGHTRVSLYTPEPSMADPSKQAECDINGIMAKWQKTGVIEHTQKYEGRYGDFCDVEDYQTSLNKIADAQDAFMSLPATLRSQFANDPAQFLDYVSNPLNHDKLVEMGLLPQEHVSEADLSTNNVNLQQDSSEKPS